MSKLPASVVLLGFTSLFADVSAEMIVPFLPIFVTVTLGASPALLGVVEGVADTVSSLLKLVAGRLSDRLGRRKPLVLLGYGLAGVLPPRCPRTMPTAAARPSPWPCALVVKTGSKMRRRVRSSIPQPLSKASTQT